MKQLDANMVRVQLSEIRHRLDVLDDEHEALTQMQRGLEGLLRMAEPPSPIYDEHDEAQR